MSFLKKASNATIKITNANTPIMPKIRGARSAFSEVAARTPMAASTTRTTSAKKPSSVLTLAIAADLSSWVAPMRKFSLVRQCKLSRNYSTCYAISQACLSRLSLLRRLDVGLRLLPLQLRLPRSARFIEPPPRRQHRRLVEALSLAPLRPHDEIAKRGHEQVERGLRFGLGRLDQERTVDDQREIHGHRVEALVDHRLGEVERGDAGAFQEAVVEKRLVHAWPVAEGLTHQVGEPGPDVVGVEDGILRGLPHAVGAVRQHVAHRADEHAHLPVERRDPAEGGRAVARLSASLDEFRAVRGEPHEGHRREGR